MLLGDRNKNATKTQQKRNNIFFYGSGSWNRQCQLPVLDEIEIACNNLRISTLCYHKKRKVQNLHYVMEVVVRSLSFTESLI